MPVPDRTRYAAVAILLIASVTTGCTSQSVTTELWNGPKPTTTAMAAADAGTMDAVGEQIIADMGGDLPGVWIGVWDAKKGYHIGAYGKAALPDTAATVSDHSRIGSVSKTFTTATVMRLVDQGRLTMDASIAHVLPDLAKRYPPLAPITVTQLIDMTSGIVDYVNTGAIFKTLFDDPKKAWVPDELIDLSQTMQNAKPGTPGYTSTATIILGQMVAAVSGKSLEDAVNETAHDAGLTQTALPAAGDAMMPAPASHGYIFAPGVNSLKEVGATLTPGTDVSDWSPSWGGAAGGMYSTVGDLGTWAGSGFGSTLLSDKLGAARVGGPTTKSEGGEAYGLGLTHWGEDWVGHTGQIIGWESFAAYNIKTGDVIVLMVNETGSLPDVLPRLLGVANPELRQTLAAGQ
jgi:D-alanyl-D-alanine carboxypeptidase